MAYDSSETRLERKLREALTKVEKASMEETVLGLLQDYAAYRDHCGYVRGLRTALDLLEETVKNANKD